MFRIVCRTSRKLLMHVPFKLGPNFYFRSSPLGSCINKACIPRVGVQLEFKDRYLKTLFIKKPLFLQDKLQADNSIPSKRVGLNSPLKNGTSMVRDTSLVLNLGKQIKFYLKHYVGLMVPSWLILCLALGPLWLRNSYIVKW